MQEQIKLMPIHVDQRKIVTMTTAIKFQKKLTTRSNNNLYIYLQVTVNININGLD